MVTEHDKNPTFETFLEGVNHLLADRNLRDVLGELDASEEGTVSLLSADPAALLVYRGVEIPEGFRISVDQASADVAKGTTTTRYCVRICAWRWCFEICFTKTTTTSFEPG
jgi:hypothetical protein